MHSRIKRGQVQMGQEPREPSELRGKKEGREEAGMRTGKKKERGRKEGGKEGGSYSTNQIIVDKERWT